MSVEYHTFGVYMTPPVYSHLQKYCYNTAGVKDLQTYFNSTDQKIQTGDPCAEVLHPEIETIVEKCNELYKDTTLTTSYKPDDFCLVYLAAKPNTVYQFRDLMESIKILEDTHLRYAHNLILEKSIEQDYFKIPKY